MEKLICNKNLALSAKAPRLSKAYKGSWGWTVGGRRSQEQALSLPLLDGGRAENRPDRFIKHCLEASLRERRALQVFDGTCGNTASPSDRDAVAPPPWPEHGGPRLAGSAPEGRWVFPRWDSSLHPENENGNARVMMGVSYRSPWPWPSPAGR